MFTFHSCGQRYPGLMNVDKVFIYLSAYLGAIALSRGLAEEASAIARELHEGATSSDAGNQIFKV
jgi:hypothetical protein